MKYWTRGRTIGRGSTAAVSLAACHSSGEMLAVKSAEVSRSESLQKEGRILSTIDSPHIVGYRGCEFGREEGRGGLAFNLFLEYVPRGSLSDSIRKRGGLDEATIALYARQILAGLDYLHSRGIVHCDLKPGNILIGYDGAKIADFGCSKRVEEETEAAIGGTPLYMAPEAARGAEQGCPADVWAFGCTVVEMASGKFPWAGVSDPVSAVHKIVHSGETPEIPSRLSEQGKDFLEKCLRRNPRERWTVSQLLDHPFLRQVNHVLGLKQAEESSPTSVMDQEFWESAEVTADTTLVRPSRDGGDSPDDRIKKLSFGGELPSWSLDDWWIDARGEEEDAMMEMVGRECGDGGGSDMATTSDCDEEGEEHLDILVGVGSGNSLGSTVGGGVSLGICGNSFVNGDLCSGRRTRIDSIQLISSFL